MTRLVMALGMLVAVCMVAPAYAADAEGSIESVDNNNTVTLSDGSSWTSEDDSVQNWNEGENAVVTDNKMYNSDQDEAVDVDPN